jgi:hypothetical protein
MIEAGLAAIFIMSVDPTAASPAAQPATVARAAPLGRLTIPDQIAPAVVPYLQCLYASHGVEIRSSDGRPQRPAVARGADCSAQRLEASQRAEQMLRNQHRGSREERDRFVERVLASIDSFAAQPATPPQPVNEPNAQNR